MGEHGCGMTELLTAIAELAGPADLLLQRRGKRISDGSMLSRFTAWAFGLNQLRILVEATSHSLSVWICRSPCRPTLRDRRDRAADGTEFSELLRRER
jgi:hypothetical protein